MRIIVTAQAFDDEIDGAGSVLWGYHHEEQVPTDLAENVDFAAVLRGERGPNQEELDEIEAVNNRNAGVMLGHLLKRIEEAGASIADQAAAGLPRRGPEGRP